MVQLHPNLILALACLFSLIACSAVTLESSVDQEGFTHPGVLVSASQLKFIKEQVQHGEQPWKQAFDVMLADPLLAETRKPTPSATVVCGPTSTPNIGCFPEREDALAAYASALAWVITEKESYAKKAIEYMSAWAKVIKKHKDSNAPLQTGWAGAVWPRVGEIIRYTYGKWSKEDMTAFENMLRTVYLPEVLPGSTQNGNWELVMMEAAQGISVFLSNRTSYNIAMRKFLNRVPAYIYLKSDGDLPKSSPEDPPRDRSQMIHFWQGLSNFSVDGLAQETCRDLNHTGYGLASISDVAETSQIQGRDLFLEDTGTRLQAAYELHTGYILNPKSVPSWLCHGKLKLSIGPNTEVANNAFNTRLKRGLRHLHGFTIDNRPQGTGSTHPLFFGWETLTHAGVEDAPSFEEQH